MSKSGFVRRSGWGAAAKPWLPAAVYVTGILVLALLPSPRLPAIRNADKYIHAVIYAVLSLLVLRALRANGARYAPIFAVCIALAVGSFDEALQLWGGVRRADVMDLMADGSGAIIAQLLLAIARWLMRFRGRDRQRMK